MNEEVILNMVKPYLNNKSITYDQFESIFSMLDLKEQYGVIRVLIKYNINLSDDEEQSASEEIGKVKFEILYDNSVFFNEESYELDKEYLQQNRQVKQSNPTLCKLIQDGHQFAKQELCIKNKGLVHKVANRYYKQYGNDLDYDDLVQIGMEGLIKAAERFDLDRDNAFSTYAMWWIFQYIVRGIQNEGFRIRIPVHMLELIAKIEKCEKNLVLEGCSQDDILIEIQNRLNIPCDKILKCLHIKKCYISSESLNSQIGEDGNTEIQELIPDDVASVEDIVMMHDLNEEIKKAIITLTDREQKIINLRFGLKDGRERTLEEVGKEFDVTRERIRQIEARVLRKLRHPSRSKRYIEYK